MSPSINSIIAFLCFGTGSISFLSGYTLFYDNRALIRQLTSSLLMLSGAYLVAEGFFLMKFYDFKYIQYGILVIYGVIGLTSTELLRQDKKRYLEKERREQEKAEEERRAREKRDRELHNERY